MLDHLGEREAAAAVVRAVEEQVAGGERLTRDLGGNATTAELGAAIAERVTHGG